MSSSYYFAIVGHNDNPLFEQEFVNSKEVKVSDKEMFLPRKEIQCFYVYYDFFINRKKIIVI